MNDTSRVPCRILRATCQHFTAASALVVLAACARTGLDPSELEGEAAGGGASSVPELDAGVNPSVRVSDAGSSPSGSSASCVPARELCNGRDDDCNGSIDDLPPVPCAAGGFRYCVAGKQSASRRSRRAVT